MKTQLAHSKQHGVALITVMVILLLSIIAVLAAARTGLLNEALVGSESDYNRALAAAEALLRDAESDVAGRLPNGYMCREAVAGSEVPLAGFVGCRNTVPPGSPWFPFDKPDFELLGDTVPLVRTNPCVKGICIPANINVMAGLEDNLAVWGPRGARYGEFTLAASGPNRILRNPPPGTPVDEPNQGWYWVEIFEYEQLVGGPSPPSAIVPDPKKKLIYRITAIALGQKVGTRAVVRSIFVRVPACGIGEPCAL